MIFQHPQHGTRRRIRQGLLSIFIVIVLLFAICVAGCSKSHSRHAALATNWPYGYEAGAVPQDASPAWTAQIEPGTVTLSGGVLIMDTRAVPDSGSAYIYPWSTVQYPDMTAEIRISFDGWAGTNNDNAAFVLLLSNGMFRGGLYLYRDGIPHLAPLPRQSLPVPAPGFHVYRVVVEGPNAFLYQDGVLIMSGAAGSTPENEIKFGDIFGGAGCRVQVDYIRWAFEARHP